ncbi:hypothetical protein EDD21DRAFT_419847 [Dissophora ornata]|nr:hypothetical protein BGZ58_008425 [Dissophora ornata]KAI8596253.1 hypothetical protein EDD21DRAFT_419847 [Dissophora ornata]
MTPQLLNRPKITYKSADPSFTSVEKTSLLENTENKDLLFTLTYWDIASVGSTGRDMLVYGEYTYGAKYKFESPSDDDWDNGKVYTFFSCLPMLKVSAPNGKRFNLLGDNKLESLTIQSHYSNIHHLRERAFSKVTGVPKDRLREAREVFFNTTLKKFLEDHEFHLKENGDNGHYVGDRLSLADIHLANVIHYLQTLPCGKMAEDAFRKCESVWRVKENVDRVPSLAARRATEEFKMYEKNSMTWYSRLAIPGDDSRED